MSKENRVPKIGDIVHYVSRAQDSEECAAAFISKRMKDEDGNYKPRGAATVVSFTANGASIGKDFGTPVDAKTLIRNSEHSAEGHRGTYHFPDECPEEA